MKRLILLGILALFIALPAWAAEDRPAKLSDINRLLRSGSNVEQVLVELEKRGLGFRVTPSAEKRLKEWGFNDDQINQVNRIATGLPLERGDNAPKEQDNKPVDFNDIPADLPTKFPIGYAIGDDVRDSQSRVMSRAANAARLNYKLYTFERFALYCSPRRGDDLAKQLKELEAKLVKQLPASLANATEAKTALLVLADSNRDAMKMFQSIEAAYQAEFPDYRTDLDNRRWTHYVASHYTIVDGSAYSTNDAAMRPLSFGVGRMMAAHIAYYSEPHTLATGMGNLVETIAKGAPSVTLFSHSGEDEPKIENWSADFKQRHAAKKLPKVRQLFDYQITHMKPRHYVESWALASWLAREPDKLFAALYNCRPADKTMYNEVLEVYSLTEEQFQQQWHNAIAP